MYRASLSVIRARVMAPSSRCLCIIIFLLQKSIKSCWAIPPEVTQVTNVLPLFSRLIYVTFGFEQPFNVLLGVLPNTCRPPMIFVLGPADRLQISLLTKPNGKISVSPCRTIAFFPGCSQCIRALNKVVSLLSNTTVDFQRATLTRLTLHIAFS